MTDKHCPVCGDAVPSRLNCVAEHFAFYAPGMFRYWRGNVSAFGWVNGLRGSVCLTFPFLNTLLNWRYRKARLVLPPMDGSHD